MKLQKNKIALLLVVLFMVVVPVSAMEDELLEIDTVPKAQDLIKKISGRIPNFAFDEAQMLNFFGTLYPDEIVHLKNLVEKIPLVKRSGPSTGEVSTEQVHFHTELLLLMQRQTQIQQATFEKSIQDGKDADVQAKKDFRINFIYQIVGWVFTAAGFGMSVYSLAK